VDGKPRRRNIKEREYKNNGEKNMSKVFESTDYSSVIKASELDEKGIDCVPIELERCKSEKYRNDFYRLTVEIDDNIEVIQFGNQKLGKLFMRNWEQLEGRYINISRVGEGYAARYIVKVLD
jgi:hypothetical protein